MEPGLRHVRPRPEPDHSTRLEQAVTDLSAHPTAGAGTANPVRLVRLAAAVLGADAAVLTHLDPDGVVVAASTGLAAPDVVPTPLLMGQTQTVGPVVIRDASNDPRFARDPLVASPTGFRMVVTQVLRSAAGAPRGALTVLHGQPRALTPDEVMSFEDVAHLAECEVRARTLADATGMLESLLGDATEHAIVATDEDGRITFFNRGAERMLGWRAEEVVGHEQATAFVGPTVEAALATQDAVLDATRTGATGRTVFRTRTGTQVPVSLTVTRRHGPLGGDPVGYLAIAQDITELLAAERAVSDGEQRFRAMVQHASDGIVVIDGTGRILYASPAAEALVGMPDGASLGTNVLEVIHPSDLVKASSALRNTADAEGPRPRIELRLQTSAGDIRHVELVANSLLDEPAVRGIVLNVRDISERREIDRMKDEFISIVSHELRTPLTSIRGALGLLADGAMGSLDLEATRMVEMADRNAAMLHELINEILDLGTLESGAVTLNAVPTAASHALRRAFEALLGLAADHGVSIRLAAPAPDGAVVADPDRLHQVLQNLLSNAIKFSKPGQEVHLRARRLRTQWEFSVTDEGRGIPEHMLTRVFNRFEQVDPSDHREKQGTGLGLAIAKAIVDLHGGDIDASSAPGATTVRFTMPAHEAAVGEGAATS